MKNKLFVGTVFFLCLFYSLFSKAQQTTSSPIAGTWEYVSGDATRGTSVEKAPDVDVRRFIITPRYFSLFTRSKADSTVLVAGSGSIATAGNKMALQFDYANNKQFTGFTQVLLYKLEGDKMIHSYEREGTTYREIWRRVE